MTGVFTEAVGEEDFDGPQKPGYSKFKRFGRVRNVDI